MEVRGTYTTLVSPINKCREIFHSAFSIWILEEHTANILPTEIHLMRKLENSLHTNVTKGHKLLINTDRQTEGYRDREEDGC